MKRESIIQPKTCPVCGKIYTVAPALSRKDSSTPICPDCGTREALRAMRVPEAEIEEIVAKNHQYGAKQ